MSVIGRLDDQVNEKLIEPLARKNQRVTNEPADETPRAANETEVEPTQQKMKRDALPVWLL